jgi:hypothetical protein
METAMASESAVDALVDKIEKQIPHESALVCVVGFRGSGKTTVVDHLHARGFLTYDPLGEYINKYGQDSDNNAHAVIDTLVKYEYNHTRPKVLVLDDYPFSEAQLETASGLVKAYADDLIVVHLMAPVYTRVNRKYPGVGLLGRVSRFRELQAEEKQSQALYERMAKFVPWYLSIDAG